MIICSACGNTVEDYEGFCGECGTRNPLAPTPVVPIPHAQSRTHAGVASPQPTAPPHNYHQPSYPPPPAAPYDFAAPPAAQKKGGTIFVIVLLAVLAVAGIGAAVYFATSRNSVTSSSGSAAETPDALAAMLKRAVDEGRLVTLGGNDAYTYYYRLKTQDPGHEILGRVSPQVLPRLRSLGEEVLDKRLSPQDDAIAPTDWEKSFRAFQWAHDLEPGDKLLEARWKYAEGELALSQGRIEDAERSLYAATQVDGNWAMPHNRLGRLYAENKKNFRAAIDAYERAIAIEPDWAFPHNNMGTAYYNLKDDTSAIASYQRAIRLNPSWARPHYWLGEIYERQGLKCEALREYQTVRSLDSTFKADVIGRKISSIYC